MRKHKKIYYVSGLISALLVPLLFLYYAAPVYNKMNLRVITLGLPAKSKKGEKISEYARIPTEGWSYKTINVAPHFDKKTEEFFIREINQLKKIVPTCTVDVETTRSVYVSTENMLHPVEYETSLR